MSDEPDEFVELRSVDSDPVWAQEAGEPPTIGMSPERFDLVPPETLQAMALCFGRHLDGMQDITGPEAQYSHGIEHVVAARLAEGSPLKVAWHLEEALRALMLWHADTQRHKIPITER